jgi:hypothetical protein
MLRRTVSRPVCLGMKHPSGVYNQFLLLSDICWFVDVGRSLLREDGSDVYSRLWSSPAHTFSGQSPVGLATIFYCLRFETSLSVASYDSQGYHTGSKSKLLNDRQFTADQFVLVPLETHDRRLFSNWNLAAILILSDEKTGLSVMNMFGVFS